MRVVSGDADPARLPDFSFEVIGGEDGPLSHHVTVVWDRHDAAIMEVDGFTLNSPLAGDVLITHHHDQPGVIGAVGMILARHDVNIAGCKSVATFRGGAEKRSWCSTSTTPSRRKRSTS